MPLTIPPSFSQPLSLIRSRGSEITQFIRSSPIVSGVALGGSVLGGLGLLQIIRKVRKRKKTRIRKRTVRKAITRRRRTRRKTSVVVRRKRRVGRHVHASPRHRGHKRVSFTTKTGQKVNFLVKSKRRKR